MKVMLPITVMEFRVWQKLVNLRLSVADPGGGWELALVGRNLLDESSSFGFGFPYFGGQLVPAGTTTIGSLSRPRTLALQGRYRF